MKHFPEANFHELAALPFGIQSLRVSTADKPTRGLLMSVSLAEVQLYYRPGTPTAFSRDVHCANFRVARPTLRGWH